MVLSGENQSETDVYRTRALMGRFPSYQPGVVKFRLVVPREPSDLPTNTLPLASTVLPDADSEHKRKNENAAKSLT